MTLLIFCPIGCLSKTKQSNKIIQSRPAEAQEWGKYVKKKKKKKKKPKNKEQQKQLYLSTKEIKYILITMLPLKQVQHICNPLHMKWRTANIPKSTGKEIK